MKKIFTLIVALGLLIAADAQRINNRPVVRVGIGTGNGGFTTSRFAADRQMRIEIARINAHYDNRIQQVQFSRFLRKGEKRREIRFLNDQRQREINRVYVHFRNNGNRYNHPRRYY